LDFEAGDFEFEGSFLIFPPKWKCEGCQLCEDVVVLIKVVSFFFDTGNGLVGMRIVSALIYLGLR